ncbi:hypothetical protein RHGRI_009319 [Rhododendron griersonianum]|uniref:Uncharacterized protein n=1 Tax=Rhododendron griersonianum TaxID=479676 RepID=A0AAV6KE99_9ERIC|nr:hypothetical protein RHGRI_009319 [Rhododendron griersonianum]
MEHAIEVQTGLKPICFPLWLLGFAASSIAVLYKSVVLLEGLKQYPPSTRFTKSELPSVFEDIFSKCGILSEFGKNSTALSAATGSFELSSTVYLVAPILSDDPIPGPTPTPSGSSLPEPSHFGSAPNEPLTLPSSPPTELPAPPLSDDSPLRRSTRLNQFLASDNLDLLLAGEARLLVPRSAELVPRPIGILLAEVVPAQPHQLVDRSWTTSCGLCGKIKKPSDIYMACLNTNQSISKLHVTNRSRSSDKKQWSPELVGGRRVVGDGLVAQKSDRAR